MSKSFVAAAMLLAFLPLCTGPVPHGATIDAATGTSNGRFVPLIDEEIIFRAQFFMANHCRHISNATGESWMCGPVRECRIFEVMRGNLRIKRLISPQLPANLTEGETYTFRWRPSYWARENLARAEAGGFTGMWLDGELLELVNPVRER